MAKITVNEEICKGCKLCINACPQKILVTSSEANKKGFYPAKQENEEKCTGCTFCALVCPDVAIKVYR